MSSSSDFQTSGVVLMVATLVCAVGGAIIIAPMLRPEAFPVPVTGSAPGTLDRYAEFYPSQNRQTSGATQQMRSRTQRSHKERVASYRHGSVSQEVTSHQAQMTRASYTSHSIPPASGNPQPSGKADVDRLPAASVYAPVTVHPVTVTVDGSQVADRMQSIEQQLRQLAETQQSKPTVTESRRAGGQRRRRRSKATEIVRPETMNGTLQNVTTELHALAGSVRTLQQETHANLSQLTRHQQQMDRNSHETFRHWQNVLENKLRAQELAVRTVIASRPAVQQNFSQAGSGELTREWVIRESASHQMSSQEPVGPPPGPPVIHQPPVERVPPAPVEAEPLPLPQTAPDEPVEPTPPALPMMETPAVSVSPVAPPFPSLSLSFASHNSNEQSTEITETTQSTETTESAIVEQQESLPVIPSLGQPIPQTAASVVEVSETKVETATDVAASWQDVFLPAETEHTLRQQHEVQMRVLTEDEFDALPVLEMEVTPDVPVEPAVPPQTRASPALDGGDTHERRMVTPVAFEHVYRFEMSETEPAPAHTVIEQTSALQTVSHQTNHSQREVSATVSRHKSSPTPVIEEPYIPFGDEAQQTSERPPVRYGNPRTVKRQKDARGTLLPKISFQRLSSSLQSMGQRLAN